MALTQEEIRIKAGLDYSKVTAGLTDIRGQVYKLASDVPKKLAGLLKANLYVAGASLISEILPTWDEIWNRVYGVDEAATKRLAEQGANLKKVRDNLMNARKEVDQVSRDSQFNEADNAGKMAILDAELDAANKVKKAAFDKWMFAKSHNIELEKRAELEADYWKSVTARIKAEDALKKFQSKLSPEEIKAEYDRKMNATRSQVYKDRITISAVDAEIAAGNGSDELARQRQLAIDRISGVVKARSVGGIGEASNIFSNVPFGGGIAKAFEDAQKAAMLNVIQKVQIVDIQE